MVRNNIGHPVEPENGKLVKNLSFFGNTLIHDDIEGRKPVGSNEQEVFAQIINVTDFAAVDHVQGRHVGFEDNIAHC